MLEIRAITADQLAEYAQVPIAFSVQSILAPYPQAGGLGGILLREEAVAAPYVKDYDAYESPTAWPGQFSLANWHIIIAIRDGRPVGGAAVLMDTPGIHMLRGQRDLACLWDIRVAPDQRGQGIGRALFQDCATWARSRGCRLLQIETQNINVTACRFYRAMGCYLGTIDRHFYMGSDCKDEIALLWYLALQDA